MNEAERDIEGLNVPVPDPSLLTTRSILREIFNLRELLETRLAGAEHAGDLNRAVIETRLDAGDRAIKVLQDIADKFPARIDEKILALEKVQDQKLVALERTTVEKFSGVEKQFLERDVRTDKGEQSAKTAVDAALAAQEKSFTKQGETFSEATAKTEQSFTKQIDQIRELHLTEIKGLQAQFNDLKDRFNRGEGRSEGTEKAVVVHQTASDRKDRSNEWLIGIAVGVFIAVIGIAVSIVLKLTQ